MTRDELIAGLSKLNGPDQGMNYFGGGFRGDGPRFDAITGERLSPHYDNAALTVYGDRARFLYRLIESADAVAALLAHPQPSAEDDAELREGIADDWSELERLAMAAAKRAPGLWGSDIEKSEGEYGIGDECRSGFMVPYMETEHGKRLFDAHYCDVAEVHEEYDEDGGHAWDEASREIFAFLAAAQPATILKLISAARRDDQGGWQPIETHDGSKEPVLLWFPDFAPEGVVVGFFRAAAGDCYYPGQWLDDLNNEPFEVGKGEVFPTHWRPLPAAPTQDQAR